MAIGYIVNQTGTIGNILSAGTQNLTGSMVATLFLILMIFIALTIMLRIPLEITAIIILPFCLGAGAFYSNFMIPVVAILVFLTMMIAKNWLFK